MAVRSITRIDFRSVVYINCVSFVPLYEGSKISMYADDIFLSKLVNHPDNYDMGREILMQSRNALANVI